MLLFVYQHPKSSREFVFGLSCILIPTRCLKTPKASSWPRATHLPGMYVLNSYTSIGQGHVRWTSKTHGHITPQNDYINVGSPLTGSSPRSSSSSSSSASASTTLNRHKSTDRPPDAIKMCMVHGQRHHYPFCPQSATIVASGVWHLVYNEVLRSTIKLIVTWCIMLWFDRIQQYQEIRDERIMWGITPAVQQSVRKFNENLRIN